MTGPRRSIRPSARVAMALLGMVVALAAARGEISPSAGGSARSPLVSRVDLQRHDLSIPGHEALQVRVDFEPGAIAPRHSHPGEEIIYVLKGTIEYRVDGKPPARLKAGEVLFVPAGVIHAATNLGDDIASELATYIVEKGKPLVVLAK
jgi:quercetin dioxygenase-like cupin family protein